MKSSSAKSLHKCLDVPHSIIYGFPRGIKKYDTSKISDSIRKRITTPQDDSNILLKVRYVWCE